MTETKYRWIIGVLIAILGVWVAICALHFSAALEEKDAVIERLKDDVARLENTVAENIEKLSAQQQGIERLRTRIGALTAKPVPPPRPEPIVLRGTSSQRDETQLEAIPFAGTGNLIVRASATQWAEDTSIGLQIWHPREDGIVFRAGYYRVVKNGSAVIDKPIPGWDELKRGEHTYEISWSPESLTLRIDDKLIATVPSRDLPPRSTDFLIRFNADYGDALTVQWYRARYTDASGRMITVP